MNFTINIFLQDHEEPPYNSKGFDETDYESSARDPEPPAPQIRKEFPETWLWESITDDK